jgi:hypothetical protein
MATKNQKKLLKNVDQGYVESLERTHTELRRALAAREYELLRAVRCLSINHPEAHPSILQLARRIQSDPNFTESMSNAGWVDAHASMRGIRTEGPLNDGEKARLFEAMALIMGMGTKWTDIVNPAVIDDRMLAGFTPPKKRGKPGTIELSKKVVKTTKSGDKAFDAAVKNQKKRGITIPISEIQKRNAEVRKKPFANGAAQHAANAANKS